MQANPELSDHKSDDDDGNANKTEFKQLSHFSSERTVHILQFGIVLSKNHPVLKDPEVLHELREKTKGAQIEVNQARVSLSYFDIPSNFLLFWTLQCSLDFTGSIEQISKFVKQLSMHVIKIETKYQQSLLNKDMSDDDWMK